MSESRRTNLEVGESEREGTELTWARGVGRFRSQNGGEVVFERDASNGGGGVKATFVHLMRNPADHTEVDE